jgi:hypothetical protein
MAGTTGLEPATSAVTDPRWSVTHRNQKARMANFGALGALRNAYRTLIEPSTSALASSKSTIFLNPIMLFLACVGAKCLEWDPKKRPAKLGLYPNVDAVETIDYRI